MNIDLLHLLTQREIVHPTRIVAVDAQHRSLRLTVSGYPWWRDRGDSGKEERIVLSFTGIEEATLNAESLLDFENHEALEDFHISPFIEQRWADHGSSYETYCSQPLPEPLQLYATIEDYLWKIGAPRSARNFLNVSDGLLSGFCKIAREDSYLVSRRAPACVQQIIEAELKRQGVTYNVLSSEHKQTHRLFVEIGSSTLVCEHAIAEM